MKNESKNDEHQIKINMKTKIRINNSEKSMADNHSPINYNISDGQTSRVFFICCLKNNLEMLTLFCKKSNEA